MGRAVQNRYFEKVLLINSISPYSKFLKHFIFAHVLLIAGHEKSALRKEPVIAPIVEWFRTGTLRKSY